MITRYYWGRGSVSSSSEFQLKLLLSRPFNWTFHLKLLSFVTSNEQTLNRLREENSQALLNAEYVLYIVINFSSFFTMRLYTKKN